MFYLVIIVVILLVSLYVFKDLLAEAAVVLLSICVVLFACSEIGRQVFREVLYLLHETVKGLK